MLLSVCLITKNEERFLTRCLESVAGVADEVVVVDTGSTDATCEIARTYGCRILTHPWADDYAAARNVGIAAARGRWILCIDADERLEGGTGLHRLLETAPAEAGGYLLARHDLVTDPDDGRTQVVPIGIVRLFRRHPTIGYVGSVHERPGDTILDAGLEIHPTTQLRLTHHVMELTPERLWEKQHYYLGLLERELQKDRQNFWAEYYRGKTLWYLQRVDEARASFERVIAAVGPRPGMRAWALNSLGALLSETGEEESALSCVEASLQLLPEQSFACCVLAEILYRMGRYEEAAGAFARVKRGPDAGLTKEQLHGDLYMTAERQSYKIGCCHLAQGRLREASDWFRRGLEANASDAGCYYGLAIIAEESGDRELAFALAGAAMLSDPGWRRPEQLMERLRANQPQRALSVER